MTIVKPQYVKNFLYLISNVDFVCKFISQDSGSCILDGDLFKLNAGCRQACRSECREINSLPSAKFLTTFCSFFSCFFFCSSFYCSCSYCHQKMTQMRRKVRVKMRKVRRDTSLPISPMIRFASSWERQECG